MFRNQRGTARARACAGVRLAPVLTTLLAFAVGCADTAKAPPTGDGGADVGTPCEAGQTRCQLRSYQECVGGYFTEVKRCPDDQVCAPTLGCAECDPKIGKGCQKNDRHECSAEGKLGNKIESCLGLACEAGACVNPSCAPGAHLIYAIDNQHRLFSFDPNKEHEHFTLIATLDCPAGKPFEPDVDKATPFSMSVDRGARAWVLYTSGEIFWVDTTTGECTPSPIARGQEGFGLFGMGFVADQPQSNKERLYASTEDSYSPAGPNQLGYIDPATLKLSKVGALGESTEYTAELTGTGAAELYAYFPSGADSFVARLNKNTGAVEKKWSVPAVTGVVSWAFAHWGGKFYLFVTGEEAGAFRPKVLVLDPETGEARVFLASVPYRIVGAGVSTCAPVID